MTKLFDILLVDDSAAEAGIFQEALKEASPDASAYWVSTGEDAIRYLQKEGPFADVCSVKLVVLDLNMPGLNGLETLRLIKKNPALKFVPVVLLSNSRAAVDIDSAYSLGASVFFNKPNSLEQYIEKVRVLAQHWLSFAELPSMSLAGQTN